MRLATKALTESVKALALELGFDRVAIGPARAPEHGAELRAWLDAGYAGGMAYIERRLEERLDPQRVLPGAASVVCVALNYFQGQARDLSWAAVARYAWGRDYHDVIGPRLDRLASFLGEACGAQSRGYVDTGPVMERDLAARAGLGWVGKNTMLLHPELGSWFFIGVLLTTAELDHDDPLPDRCGSCQACLDACPTGAFVGPYVLDARRCISYLTIEHRGDIDPDLHEAMGRWRFGCDVCQDVCPWNRKAPVASEAAFQPRASCPTPEEMAGMDDEALRRRFAGTALLRAKPAGLRRNAAIALGNTGRGGARRDTGGHGAALDAPRRTERGERLTRSDQVIDPRHDALMIVDVQNDFCPGGTLGVPEGHSVVAPLNRYAERFAAAGAAVFATRDWHPERTKHFQQHGGPWPPHCIQGTAGAEFHRDLRLPPGAVVISKGMDPDEDAYSAFHARDDAARPLAELLRARGVRRIFVGGLATDYCVKATALDAIGQGFEVVVLEDAIGAVNLEPDHGRRALEAMKSAGAGFATLERL